MPQIPKDQEDLLRQRFLGGLSPSGNPTVFCMAGIPGAGKSTYVKQALQTGHFPSNAFLLDPDGVMTALPEYQRDYENLGRIKAFENWEMPARDLAYAMLKEAVVQKFDIIKDMGCVRLENYEKLASMKTLGYRIHMFYIECPVDEALRRAATRPRYISPETIRERAISLADLLPHYKTLVDQFITLDNRNLSVPYNNSPTLQQ